MRGAKPNKQCPKPSGCLMEEALRQLRLTKPCKYGNLSYQPVSPEIHQPYDSFSNKNHKHPGKFICNPQKMEAWKMIVLFHSVILRFHANFHLFPTFFDSKNHHTCRNIIGPNIIVKCRRPSEQRPSHYNKKHVLSVPPKPPGSKVKERSPRFQRRCFAPFPMSHSGINS